MESIFHRVSMRRFQDRPVEREKTEAILRAAMQAPSAANASAVIVSVYRKDCLLPDYAEIDLSIAMENLWLETDAQGLGGVWLGIAPLEDRMKAVEKVLDIPDHLRAFALFPYGYPAEERKQQNRYDESRIHYVE